MPCCLSVYFLVVFKIVLRGLYTFGFVGLKFLFWVLFVELGGLLTPFLSKLSLDASCFVETLIVSPSSRRVQVTCSSPVLKSFGPAFSLYASQVTCSSPFRPAFSPYPRPLYIRVYSRLEDNSQFSYT